MSELRPDPETQNGDDVLEELTEEFLRRHRAGECPSVEEYTAKHPELANRIRDLLAAVMLMEQPGATIDVASPSERVGATIDRYKLLERIGEGGFGVVYMAEQQQPVRRKVALKVIKPGVDTRQVIARFEAERQALALMEHENIAKVLDAGATESGRPYFVMELVRGVPITEFCDANELPPRERLELFVLVCRAVQHAHTKGIIHRDIKPTNVLVTLNESVPVPKVIDFGVAKATGQQLTEKTLFTQFAQMVGTPLYMSPEQAQMTSIDVDTRSDVYSLGVLLYELLTGTTPLDSERLKRAAFDEVRRIIREEEPPRPSTRLSTLGEQSRTISACRKSDPKALGRFIRGELDWIVMKSLEKDRARRYETASGLAQDIERYLLDETVEACPPSAAYRFSKFARRNRRALATGAIVFAALLAGTIVSTWQAIRATRATDAERLALTAAEESERVAIANADTARRQSFRARKYFLGARSVVDGMTQRLDNSKLLQIPEVTAIRKQLLEDLLHFYQQMVQDNAVDASVGREKGHVLREVGDIRHMLGDPVSAEKAYREAIAMLEPYVAQHPDDAQSYHFLAICHAHLGGLLAEMNRPAEAETAYRRALVLWAPFATDSPYDGAGVFVESLGRFHKKLFALLEHSGQSEAARSVCGQLLAPFEEAAAKAPEDVDLQLRLADALICGGDLLKDTGRAEEGRKLHDRALNLYGKLPGTTPPLGQMHKLAVRYVRKAELLDKRQRWTDAESAYRKAIELSPQFDVAYGELGKMLMDQKKVGEAISVYKNSVAAIPSPGYPYVHRELAWLLANCSDVRLRDPSQAVVLAKKAIELAPSFPDFTILGVAYYRARDWKAAIAALEKSTELNKGGNSVDWFFLAMAKWQSGERDAAREWYDKPVEWMQKDKPDHARGTFFIRNKYFFHKNKPDHEGLIRFGSEAAEVLGVNAATFRKALALQLNPKDVNARLNLADALWGERKLGEATDEYREVLRLEPENADARRQLALALNEQAWTSAVDSDPAKRDPRRATKLAREAVELGPKVADYWNTLGVAEYRDGNWKDAISSLQKYRALRTNDDEGWNPFFLAMTHWRLGNKDEARSWYDKGVGWMDKQHGSTSKTLIRFRSEAAELLGVSSSGTTAPGSPPASKDAPEVKRSAQ